MHFGIHTFYDANDFIGNFNHPFFHHLVIADDVQLGTGGHQGNLVDFIILEENLWTA